MKSFLAWLMLACVFAGLNVRVLASFTSHAEVSSKAAHACCSEHQDPSGPEEHHPDDGCPQNHHHHSSCCSQCVAFAFENHQDCKVGILGSSYSGVQDDRAILPEAPVLGSEKPPLI
jgi:hypothetical protein